MCLENFDQYSNSGAECITGEPLLRRPVVGVQIDSVYHVSCGFMATVRSCHGVKIKSSVRAFDHSHLFRAEFQIVKLYVYSVPYVFVLLRLTEHRGWTFTVRTDMVECYFSCIEFSMKLGEYYQNLNYLGRNKRQIARVIVCQLFTFNDDEINSLLIITGT